MAEKKTKEGARIVTLNDLLFNVESRQNPRITNSEYSQIIVGNIYQDEFKGYLEVDLNYCSSRYELVPNSEIFPNIEQVLNDNGVQYSAQYSQINNARFYVDYRITDNRYAYQMKQSNGKDTIEPLLRVQHSYNGLTRYKICFGYYRLVCTNGLVIPVEEMKHFNLNIIGKHTDSIKHSFKKLDELLKFFVCNAITSKFELLGGSMVTNIDDRIKEVMNASGMIIIENPKNKPNVNNVNDIRSRIFNEAHLYNGQINDWLIFNGINQYLNDDNINIAAPEKRQEIDSLVLEYMLETVN